MFNLDIKTIFNQLKSNNRINTLKSLSEKMYSLSSKMFHNNQLYESEITYNFARILERYYKMLQDFEKNFVTNPTSAIDFYSFYIVAGQEATRMILEFIDNFQVSGESDIREYISHELPDYQKDILSLSSYENTVRKAHELAGKVEFVKAIMIEEKSNETD